MQISARVLGKEYGLTAEEMNLILLKLGFLKGKPGDYSLTEKAQRYAVEKDFHRGTGGYARYNCYWTTRTFDDSIKEALDVSPNLIKEVQDELTSIRASRSAAQAAARARADAEFLSKQASEKMAAEAAERAALKTEEIHAMLKKAGKIGLVVGGIIIVGYGVYKATPRIKEWWHKRKNASGVTEDNVK